MTDLELEQDIEQRNEMMSGLKKSPSTTSQIGRRRNISRNNSKSQAHNPQMQKFKSIGETNNAYM